MAAWVDCSSGGDKRFRPKATKKDAADNTVKVFMRRLDRWTGRTFAT
jgi:hypothetical protein